MDKFFTNTLTQKYINNLLQFTEVPIVDFVKDGDFVINGEVYIYYFQYIACTKTGHIGEEAEYEVLEPYYFWSKHYKYTRNYVNKYGFYSSEAHRKLGDYLRAFHYNGSANLMGMYNCYDCTSTDNISIAYYEEIDGERVLLDTPYVEEGKTNHKVALVPIKFNKPYTVSLESKTQFRVAPVLCHNDKLVYIYNDSDTLVDATNTYLQNIETKPLSAFNTPWLFNVDLSSKGLSDKVLKQLYDRQGDLYLMIDLIFSNQSTIIVLEGDYTEKTSMNDDSEERSEMYYSPLLQMYNTNFNIPYSDNLVQYITNYAVFDNKENDYNVRKLREIMGFDPAGGYDRKLRKKVFETALNSPITFKTDIYGYVDSNVERVIKI